MCRAYASAFLCVSNVACVIGVSCLQSVKLHRRSLQVRALRSSTRTADLCCLCTTHVCLVKMPMALSHPQHRFTAMTAHHDLSLKSSPAWFFSEGFAADLGLATCICLLKGSSENHVLFMLIEMPLGQQSGIWGAFPCRMSACPGCRMLS